MQNPPPPTAKAAQTPGVGRPAARRERARARRFVVDLATRSRAANHADLRLMCDVSNPQLVPRRNLDDRQRAELAAKVRAALSGPTLDVPGWNGKFRPGMDQGVLLRDPLAEAGTVRWAKLTYEDAVGDQSWRVGPRPAGVVGDGLLWVRTENGPVTVADTNRDIELWCLAAIARGGWRQQVRDAARSAGGVGARRVRRALRDGLAHSAAEAARRTERRRPGAVFATVRARLHGWGLGGRARRG